MRTRTIALINYKGGVGKTSITVNMAAYLAQIGSRVLVIDCDPQSNSSIWMLRLNRWNRIQQGQAPGLVQLLRKPELAAEEVIQKDVLQDDKGKALLPGLDLLPTTFELMDLEADEGHERYPQRFYEKMRKVSDRYDYILMDCSPGLYEPSRCALAIAEELFVPANPDALSLVGFSLLSTRLNSLPRPGAQPCPLIRGIIFNNLKAAARSEVAIERFQAQLDRFRKSRPIADDARLMRTRIRDAICVSRSSQRGLPICLLPKAESTAGIRMDYYDLAEEIDAMGALPIRP